MILEVTYYKKGNMKDVMSHQMLVDPDIDKAKVARDYVNTLNESLAGFQLPYILLGTKESHLPDPRKPENHDWETSSPAMLYDGTGKYHIVRCSKCGITGRQYEGHIRPTLDSKYLSKKFDNCATVIRRDERRRMQREGVRL